MNVLIEYQYFGAVTLYNTLYKSKNIIFEQYENYQKSSFRNKMYLASPNGRQLLSIPILGGRGIKLEMNKVQIDNRIDWKTNHIKTINNLYNRSPFYEFYKYEIELLYKKEIELLKDWNLECIKWACSKLKISASMAETDSFQKSYNSENILDYRSFAKTNDNKLQIEPKTYNQVFNEKNGFIPNLCILDLIFCEGPNAKLFLE